MCVLLGSTYQVLLLTLVNRVEQTWNPSAQREEKLDFFFFSLFSISRWL